MSISTSWFSAALATSAPRLLSLQRITQGTTGYLEEQTGRRMASGRDELTVAQATVEVVEQLQVPEGSFVLTGRNYIQLRVGASEATAALLRDYVTSFAEREGYVLAAVSTATEGAELPVVAALVDRVATVGARTVLVAGPSRAALTALHMLRDVRVLTLADVCGHNWS